MAYAVSTDGVRIAYEVVGQGPPLLLHHGFMGCGADWQTYGYVDALQNDFQLILMDGRGHGQSDKPYDPAAYAIEQRAADIVAVLDALGLQHAHVCGYSLGGLLGFGLGVFAPERATSLMLGGSHPFPAPPGNYDAWIAALRPGMENYVAGWEEEVGRLPEPFRSQLLANDIEALIAERLARRAEGGLEWGLSRMTMPCLIYAGDQDEPVHTLARQAATQLPNAEFVSLAGCDHAAGFFDSANVVPHLHSFLQRVG